MREQYQIVLQAFVAQRVIPDAELATMVEEVNRDCPGLSLRFFSC